jgi:hypothetical protein
VRLTLSGALQGRNYNQGSISDSTHWRLALWKNDTKEEFNLGGRLSEKLVPQMLLEVLQGMVSNRASMSHPPLRNQTHIKEN